MERFTWRYQPEFILTARINGEPAKDIEVFPSAKSATALSGWGMITRMNGSTLSCFGRQLLNGTDWEPAYSITHPLPLHFWIRVVPGSSFHIPGVFSNPAVRFGKTIFYANNLSPAGEIDTPMAGNKLELIPDPGLINEKKAALSACTPAAKIIAGDYTAVKAGKIRPGAAVSFLLSNPISPLQTAVALDLRSFPGDAFQVILEGDSPAAERVIPDESALATGVDGVVTIYKDTWRAPSDPIEYSINFIT